MRFTLEQVLPGTVDAVIAALIDPAFLRTMDTIPNLSPPELLDQRRDGGVVVQRIQHRFRGTLSPAVSRIIDPRKVTWVEETVYDTAAGTATFRIHPDHYAGKLRCSGTLEFTATGRTTIRRVDAELSVGVPLVGRVVERAIASGLEEHLEREAALLADWLENNG